MKSFLTLFIVLIFGMTNLAWGQTNMEKSNSISTKTVILNVPGMVCSICPITIRKALQTLHGVKKVTTNVHHKTVKVKFDPKQTTIQQILSTTKNSGYPATLSLTPVVRERGGN